MVKALLVGEESFASFARWVKRRKGTTTVVLALYLVYCLQSGVVVGGLWCSCCSGRRGGEEGLVLNSGHLVHLHTLTKTMSISWNYCRCQQNPMGPGSVFQWGTPTRTLNHMDPANHKSQHLRSKTILSIQSKTVYRERACIYTPGRRQGCPLGQTWPSASSWSPVLHTQKSLLSL